MMENSQLVEKLLDKTMGGKIAWKSTYEPGTFVASVEGELGLELGRPEAEFITLKIYDTDGNQIVSTAEPVPGTVMKSHPLLNLSRLYELAKDEALSKRAVIERLAKAERLLDAL